MQTTLQSFGIDPGWMNAMLRGSLVTLEISISAFFLGMMIGLAVASIRLYGPAFFAKLARGYSTIFRAVPELLLILLLFYAGTMLINKLAEALGASNIDLSGPVVATVVLAIVQGAYAAEIFRAAIQSIPYGQIEAARAYGMSGQVVFRRVTLPIMAPNAIAGMANLWVNLVKDSALISVVGTNELLFTAKQAAGSTRQYLTYYLCAALIYYIITVLSNAAIRVFEKRMRRWMPEV